MDAVPQIFAEGLMAARRDRAPAPLFLNQGMAAQLLDRLDDVTRSFDRALILGHVTEEEKNALRSHAKIKQCDFAGLGAEQNYDLIISLWELGMMNDVPGYLARIKQSLKPDGWLLAVFYGGESLIELRHALWQADEEIYGGVSPRVAPMIDLRDAAGLLQRAGFALPVADHDIITVEYPHLAALLQDLRRSGYGNNLAQRRQHFSSRRFFARAAELYAEHHSAGHKIPATAEVIFLSAWTPDAAQQKPLLPGSATQRLADALQATEHKL